MKHKKSITKKGFYPTTKKLPIKWYHWIAGVGKSTTIAKRYFLNNRKSKVWYLTHSHLQALDFRQLVIDHDPSMYSIYHHEGTLRKCQMLYASGTGNIDIITEETIKRLMNAGIYGSKGCTVLKAIGICTTGDKFCTTPKLDKIKKVVSVADMLPNIPKNRDVLILDDTVLEKARLLSSCTDTDWQWIRAKNTFLRQSLSESQIHIPLHMESTKTVLKYWKIISQAQYDNVINKFHHEKESFLDVFSKIPSKLPSIDIQELSDRERKANDYWYNPSSLKFLYWKRLQRAYGTKQIKKFDLVSYPLIFDFFTYLKDNPKTQGIISAASSKHYKIILMKLASRYEKEFGVRPVFDIVPVPEGKHLGKQGKIYQYYRNTARDTKFSSQYWTNSKIVKGLVTKTFPLLYSHIIPLKKLNDIKHGWITKLKANAKKKGKWQTTHVKDNLLKLAEKELNIKDIKLLYYGNIAGSNKLRDVDMLTIFGTFYPNVQEAKEMCQALFPDEPIINSKVWPEKDQDGNTVWKYESQTLQDFMDYLQENTMYQAVHRARMKERFDLFTGKIINKPPDILAFCLLPENVRKEYHIIPITVREDQNGRVYYEFGHPLWEEELRKYMNQQKISEIDVIDTFNYLKKHNYYDKTRQQFRTEAQKSFFFDYDTKKSDKKKRGRRRMILRLKTPV